MTPMNDDRRRDSKPNKHSSEGNARRKPKAISDLSVSAMSSFINSPATTKETGASPGRMRNLQVPPPIPRRADFGYYYPDGGWGWIVCGAAFTIHFLAHGLHLAFGVTLMEVINTFGTRTCDSGWSIFSPPHPFLSWLLEGCDVYVNTLLERITQNQYKNVVRKKPFLHLGEKVRTKSIFVSKYLGSKVH